MWRHKLFLDTKISLVWRLQVQSCLILYIPWPCCSNLHRVGHFLQDCIRMSQLLYLIPVYQLIKYWIGRLSLRSFPTVDCILKPWTIWVKHQYWGNPLYGMWKWVTACITGDPEHQSKPKRNLWGKKRLLARKFKILIPLALKFTLEVKENITKNIQMFTNS